MEPRMAAQLQAEKTYSDFLAWSITAFTAFLASLIILAFFNFGRSHESSVNNLKHLLNRN